MKRNNAQSNCPNLQKKPIGSSMKHFIVLSVAVSCMLSLNQFSWNIEQMYEINRMVSLKEAKMGVASSQVVDDGKTPINLDHGDPTMYEEYWHLVSEKTTIVIPGNQGISYFSDVGNVCWFLEPQFARAVTRLHEVVGNAITEGYHIVVGTGSSQLYQAALYALTPHGLLEPIDVVSEAPFYSSYPLITDFLESGLYRWGGDAYKYDKDGPYIEIVTTPNNPDGLTRWPVVNRSGGMLIYDLAYYWPQYTPITSPANHDIMLFTVSKCSGHAGSRIGWALVKDEAIARKMTKYIEISTIGVSKDSQIRAAKVFDVISDSHEHKGSFDGISPFFDHSYDQMTRRWQQLREAVSNGTLFSLPDFPPSALCTFSGRTFAPISAFAWLKCERVEHCANFFKQYNIYVRDGSFFGTSSNFVRISMLDRPEKFEMFIQRLMSIINSFST
ncbi:transaminase [Lithospermum erythrorhizon]|uniref:Transaminase n=1 Tax=Lithospermum erythrorhizon TaxID=34254 RepID=A0AAV3RTN0_LITER